MFSRFSCLALPYLTLLILSFFAAPLASAPRSGKQYHIAIAPVHTKSRKLHKSARAISKFILDRFVEQRDWIVVEREELRSLQRELALQQSGALDSRQTMRLGKMLSANKLLLPELLDTGGQYLLHLRLLDVEQARVEFSTKTPLPAPLNMKKAAPVVLAACDELIQKMKAKAYRPYYTGLVPGWAQFQRGQFWWGLGFSSASVLAAGAYFQSRSDYFSARRQIQDPLSPAFVAFVAKENAALANYFYFQALKQDVRNKAQRTNALAWGLATLFIGNYLHALFYGPENPLFGSNTKEPQSKWQFTVFPVLFKERLESRMQFSWNFRF